MCTRDFPQETHSMWQRISVVGLTLVANFVALAQTHQHGATATGDGQYNPFIVSGNRGGLYLAYVERLNNVSDVMLRHSSDGVNFSTPVRVNDRAGDATVRNENPPKVTAGAQSEVYVCWANEHEKWKGNRLVAMRETRRNLLISHQLAAKRANCYFERMKLNISDLKTERQWRAATGFDQARFEK